MQLLNDQYEVDGVTIAVDKNWANITVDACVKAANGLCDNFGIRYGSVGIIKRVMVDSIEKECNMEQQCYGTTSRRSNKLAIFEVYWHEYNKSTEHRIDSSLSTKFF